MSGPASPAAVTAPGSAPLSIERRQTLQAVVARILPGTDLPGARESDAAVAVEGALQHRSMRGLRRAVDRLLDQIEARAGEVQMKAFSACAPEEQDALLRAFDDPANPRARFVYRIIIGLSLQGLLGDPIHGGNRDFCGWTALGIEPAAMQSGLCRGARVA